ncbi:hypothetical protein INT48_004272 [Thamnidium elegans]|uniref:Rieske domain-containing protein n=1 Tax=Thamnidium elegans TaxID=101142 RepID=A0A8H7VYD1_9FUNG|nr:hypothetical protein INT48_004272 [Thamnidium elegans]
MFEPTIKYRRVNDSPKDISQSLNELSITNDKATKDNKVVETAVKDNKVTIATQPTAKVTEATKETKFEPRISEVKQSLPASTDTKIDDTVKTEPTPKETPASVPEYTFEEEEEDSSIEVDPKDKERIIVTLSTGKQFSADRYCPHAGADLSYHGRVSEHDYPPEIGPVLMCPIHYWEFALEKEGKGGGGWATINACPIEVFEKCASDKKLDW